MPVGSVTMGGGGSAWIELDDIMSRAAVSRTATALVVVVVLAALCQLLVLCRKVVLKLAAKANMVGWQSNNDGPGLSPTKESPRRDPRPSTECREPPMNPLAFTSHVGGSFNCRER